MGITLQANETPKTVSSGPRDLSWVHRAGVHAKQPGAHKDPLTKMCA